jgi:putative DNA primase/helicase
MIKYDGEFDLSVGKNRLETKWKQERWTWSKLAERLKTTHRTHETFSEYLKATKTRQTEIKDVGGFVGGLIQGGRRKKGSIVHRQLITLDLDYAEESFSDDLGLCYLNAAVVYSTHKHAPNHPRMRLVMPLSREVMADEYEAISRKISDVLGMHQFDKTTFSASRLMYWPSTAVDGDYHYFFQDGPWIDPDEVLGMYHDWRDTTQWPGVDDEIEKLGARAKKQGDPTEKTGIVGAWCRVYTIHEAIETFLNDVYVKSDIVDRYTYKDGSTSNGVVIYDEMFSYSNHSTDPATDRLCNAFDVVRIHKFGHLDEKVQGQVPMNKMPSFLEMMNFATKDKAVRRLIGEEKLSEARGDFEGYEQEDLVSTGEASVSSGTGSGDTDWLEEMDVDSKGNYKSTIENCLLVLNNDPMLRGQLMYDEFTKRFMIRKRLPWRKPKNRYDQIYVDVDDSHLRNYFESVYKIVHRTNLTDAVEITFAQNRYHPVRQYLEGLLWDGEERVETAFIDYLGADDNEYVRSVTKKMLVAAVARVYRPGIKFDNMAILVGEQGIFKSTMIKKLGRDWYSDSFGTLHNGKAYESIQGVWIMEMGELASLKKSEVEEIKHFMSKQEDAFRPAYARKLEVFPRQCIFFGTTNEDYFLQDKSGNRRFWPIKVNLKKATKSVSMGLDDVEVGQIWAEAIELYEAGENLYLDKRVEEMAKEMQHEHTEEYSHAGLIKAYLDKLIPESWPQMSLMERRAFLDAESDDELVPVGTRIRNEVCVPEIWREAVGGTLKDINKYVMKDIRDYMKSQPEWKRAEGMKRFSIYGVQRYFQRVHPNKLSSLD